VARTSGSHRVYAQADDRNVAVHRLLERLGFRCQARLVEADWFKGEWTTLRMNFLRPSCPLIVLRPLGRTAPSSSSVSYDRQAANARS
jgi:hypothetical protein